jgi:TP901 family phage tail tape measure protein
MAVQINVAANQAALTASIQAGVQAYNQRFAQNNPINLSINQRAFSQPLGRMTGDVKDFEAALAASNARVIAFGASTAVLGGVIRSFKELANVTIDVEKNLADINRVFGLTTSQLQKFSTDLFGVGKQTASSFDDASKAALEFSRQGLKAEEVLIRTKDALTLARVAGISTANSVDALTSTINGFSATGITTTQILNKLVAVEQDFAVGAGDLAEALSRTGQAAQEAGVSLDQLNALVTSAQQSTARGGAVIGNALKTIFTRLQRTDTLDQLEAFNVAVRDVQGNTLPAVTILQNFAGAYKGLADAQRAQLSEQVAGVYQVNILKAIVGDLNKSQGVYAGALQRGASATNEAEVATAKLNQTLDALLKQTATSTQQLANNIGKVTFEPLARYGTEQLKSLVESMNEILEGEGVGSTFANGLLKGIRNVIAGPGAIAAFFTLFKLIQNSFTYLAQALPQIAGITTETQNRKNIEQSILQIMQQQGPVSQALAGSMGNQAAQAQLLLQLARQQTAEYQIQSTLAKQLATQLAGQGVRVKGSGGLQVTRAGGYIPAATRMAETVGAQAGGYAPGKVVKSPVGGVMNTAEDVKYVPGFAQPFINPPAGSKAGRVHRQNAISRTGVDPYMYGGFMPNFSVLEETVENIGKRYPYVQSALNKNTGLEKDDKIILDHFEREVIPFNKKELQMAKKDQEKSYEQRVLRVLKFNNNSGLFNGPNSAIDGYSGSFFAEVKSGSSSGYTLKEVKDKFLRAPAENAFLKNKKWNTFYKNQKDRINVGGVLITPNSKGFIPNFATPVDSARIPWFKKYASSYKNIASDKDVFRQIDFLTYGKGLDHSYAKIGNPDMVSFLYEDFVRSAMNIALGSKQVVRSKEAGFKNTPTNAISNRDPIDLAQKISGAKFRMLEVKQSKNNQKDTISQISDAKLRGLFEENPGLAKNVELMSIVFNDPRYVDPTGKNPAGILSPFEQSIAPIVKNSYADVDPTMRGKLGLLTDGLMKRYQSKKNSFSKGFVPNFAYKQAVMGLEESMSGEKAVFDNKPFPHIRNKSQPTFSSAISDHGGLSNALSDSMRGQKDAGLMNKGYVPNFAAPQNNRDFDVVRFSSLISKSVDDFGKKLSNKIIMVRESILLGLDLMNTNFDPRRIERTAESTAKKIISSISNAGDVFNNLTKTSPVASQRLTAAQMASSFGNLPTKNSGLEKFSENLSKASTAIAIAGPILAGFAEQAIYGDRKRTEMSSNERFGQSALSTGLSSISTGAGIGAVFGPVGAAIGGLIGVTVGLTSAFSATKLSTEELMQLNQEQTQKAQANITAASSYVEAQRSLTQMISSGASSSDIEIAGKKLSDNFNEIKDVKLQEIFNATGGDVAAMSKQLQEYTNQVTKESAKQTGLYGANIKPQERASALSLGLGKEGSKDFVSKIRQGLSNIEIEKEKAFKVERAKYVGMSTDVVDYILKEDGIGESVQRKETEKLAASLVPENEPERETKIQELNRTLLNKNFEEVLKFIEKINLTSEAQKATDDFKQVATRSFNQIFLDMEKAIAKSAFDVALSFEKDSGSRRIQSAILDFSMNFEESLNSFISNNLPDARKFDFTAATAGQKAQMLLQKSQQDYNKAIAEQDNERASFLNKSSETLTEKFKTSFLPSQASAEFFQSQVLPQIQAGTFSGDAKSLSEQFKNVSFEKAQSKFSKTGLDGTLDKDNIVSDLNRVKNFMQVFIDANLTNEDQYKKLQEAQKALIDLQNQTALFENENGMTKMQNVLDIAANEKVLFEQKQANAKKEAEINKQLTAVSIKANEEMAVQKAAVDKQNLMRLENMKNVSAAISNNLEISKARSNAKINTLQGDLADPRLDYGSSAKEVTGRKIAIESQILKTQRAEEDAAISAEIQQRVLQMAAEQENTNALYELTKAITDYMGNLLQQDLGGQEGIADIKGRVNEMGQYAQNDVDLKYGSGSFAKFEAYQRTQQSKTSANVIGKLDAAGFNATGADGKLLMTQEDQLKTLTKMSEDYEKSGDVVAKGIVDRYKAEIINKKTSLAITRENIDEELRRKQILEQQSHILTERFKKGYSGMSAASDRMIEDLVERTPERFADGMTNALMEVAKGTKSIGDAFKDMAINFGQEIMQAVMRAAIGKMVGSSLTSLFGQAGGSVTSSKIGRQTGGVIHAQNGMYISGGRTGDKNPAMLEDGEYVLNREAVKAFGGVNNLDKMNYDMAPRFGKKMQGGGSVNLFAGMGNNKKGEYDYTGDLMSGSTNIGKINESDYTAYAYAESDYFKKMREKSIADEQERVQKKFEKDKKNAQLISSIVGAVGSLALAGGMALNASAAASGSQLASGVADQTVKGATPAVQQGLQQAAKQGPKALDSFAKANASLIQVKGQALSSLQYASQGISGAVPTGLFKGFSGSSQMGSILSEQGINAAKKTAGSGFLSNLFKTGISTTAANTGRRKQTGGLIGFNSGGFVPYGSRLSDTIPALLTGGEYVMNNTAVKKYGLGTMSSMNAGAYQQGGSTATSSNNTNNNATSIAINIDKSGKSVYGANSSSYEKQDIAFTKEMAQQINGIVLRSMSNEKRYGGELYKNSSRT